MRLFKTKRAVEPVVRDFEPAYLIDSGLQSQFEEYGYAIARNVIDTEEIEHALEKFAALKELEGYHVDQKFESSGNFLSVDIQQFVFDYVYEFMNRVAPRFAALDNCEIGRGGAFFIKPNTSKSKLEPHQDSPVIDETRTYAIFTWMPLHDITENNGPLYVLPGSHLWGNAYRSQHVPWAFRKTCDELWKHMVPLYVQKGDVIFFDPSIIHGSGLNSSGDFRIVLCGALLPKDHQKIEYTLESNQIRQYYIDDNYWLDGGDPTSLVNYRHQPLPYEFPNPVKKRDIAALTKTVKQRN